MLSWRSADPELVVQEVGGPVAGKAVVDVSAGKYRTAVVTSEGDIFMWEGWSKPLEAGAAAGGRRSGSAAAERTPRLCRLRHLANRRTLPGPRCIPCCHACDVQAYASSPAGRAPAHQSRLSLFMSITDVSMFFAVNLHDENARSNQARNLPFVPHFRM